MNKLIGTIWSGVGFLLVCVLPASGTIEFGDGATHSIDCVISEDVWIDYGLPRIGTTVNFIEGAAVTYQHTVTGFGSSVMNVVGGQIDGLIVEDNATLNVTGGSMDHVYARHSSVITVSGGRVDWNVMGTGYSRIDVSGGQILSGVTSHDNCVINLTGGTIGGVFSGTPANGIGCTNMGALRISGGVVYGNLVMYDQVEAVITGGLFGGDFIATGSSQITIYGTGFNYGLGEIPVPVGVLTGTLANGDLLHNRFYLYDDARIILIPEPCSLLLLGLGALALRGRKDA